MIWTIIGILAVLALIQGLIEPFLLRTTYASYPLSEDQLLQLRSKKTLNPQAFTKDTPTPAKGKLRVLFFSDLHANHFHLPTAYFIKRLLEHQPDIIVFGGDLVSREFDGKKGLRLLKAIAVSVAKQSVPVLVIRGNHDAKLSDDDLRQCGVTVLRNAGTRVRLKKRYQSDAETTTARDFIIYGLDDRRVGQVDMPTAEVTDAIAHTEALNITFTHARMRFEKLLTDAEDKQTGSESHVIKLLFAHNPDTVLGLSDADCDYFFAGHFHGGQIRMPFRLEFKSLREEKLSQQRYYNGHFLRNGITAFISRGVGCVLFPLRFFSRPEITFFDI